MTEDINVFDIYNYIVYVNHNGKLELRYCRSRTITDCDTLGIQYQKIHPELKVVNVFYHFEITTKK